MADKKIDELTLGEEFEGMPVHLMVRQSDPPQRPVKVEEVGYYQQATDVQEMFDVGGSVAQAQKVIDDQVIPAARAYLEVAPPMPVVEGEAEVPADKPLTAAQVKAANARKPPAKK